MAFYYELPLPELHVEPGESAVLDSWIAEPHDALDVGAPVATVRAGDERYRVAANGVGVLGQQLVRAGDVIEPGQALATVHADGECVPYGRPHSLLLRA